MSTNEETPMTTTNAANANSDHSADVVVLVEDIPMNVTANAETSSAITLTATESASVSDHKEQSVAISIEASAIDSNGNNKLATDNEKLKSTTAYNNNNNHGTALTFENIVYKVPTGGLFKKNKKEILKGITGCVRPGQLLAVMGPSGGGKTTLLNVLSGRVANKGDITGDIRINGQKFKKSLKRKIGYVMQDDVLIPTLTVRETLTYAAQLRLPRTISMKEKKRRVEDMITMLGLGKCANTRIGDASKRGISGGERKRVSIAVELITEPDILFLDEPTSGLDSFNTFSLVQSLLEVARTKNKTIVTTIHQPRSQVYQLFDSLMLLSEGNVVYNGPANEAVAYFAKLGHQCPEYMNPADYFLDLITPNSKKSNNNNNNNNSDGSNDAADSSAEDPANANNVAAATTNANNEIPLDTIISSSATPQTPGGDDIVKDEIITIQTTNANATTTATSTSMAPTGRRPDPFNIKYINLNPQQLEELAVKYKESPYCAQAALEVRQIRAEFEELQRKKNQGRTRAQRAWHKMTKSKFALPFLMEVAVLFRRTAVTYIRDLMSTTANIVQQIIMALIIGTSYFGLKNTQASIQDRSGGLFFIAAHFAFSGLGILNTFPAERAVLNRERASGYYRVSSYFICKSLVEVPLLVLNPLIFLSIAYWMVKFQQDAGKFFVMLGFCILANFTSQSFGFALSAVSPNVNVANIIAPIVLVLYMLFGGLYVNSENIPVYYKPIEYLSHIKYFYQAIFRSEFTGLKLTCTEAELARYNGMCPVINGSQVIDQFGVKSELWENAVALIGLIIGYRIIAYFAVRFLYKRTQ